MPGSRGPLLTLEENAGKALYWLGSDCCYGFRTATEALKVCLVFHGNFFGLWPPVLNGPLKQSGNPSRRVPRQVSLSNEFRGLLDVLADHQKLSMTQAASAAIQWFSDQAVWRPTKIRESIVSRNLVTKEEREVDFPTPAGRLNLKSDPAKDFFGSWIGPGEEKARGDEMAHWQVPGYVLEDCCGFHANAPIPLTDVRELTSDELRAIFVDTRSNLRQAGISYYDANDFALDLNGKLEAEARVRTCVPQQRGSRNDEFANLVSTVRDCIRQGDDLKKIDFSTVILVDGQYFEMK